MNDNREVIVWNGSDVYAYALMFLVIGVLVALTPLYWLWVLSLEMGKTLNTNLAYYGIPAILMLSAIGLFFFFSAWWNIHPGKMWLLWLVISIVIGNLLAYLLPDIQKLQVYPELVQFMLKKTQHIWYWLGSSPNI